MAERLGRGLQNLVQRFNSASRLHFVTATSSAVFYYQGRKTMTIKHSIIAAFSACALSLTVQAANESGHAPNLEINFGIGVMELDKDRTGIDDNTGVGCNMGIRFAIPTIPIGGEWRIYGGSFELDDGEYSLPVGQGRTYDFYCDDCEYSIVGTDLSLLVNLNQEGVINPYVGAGFLYEQTSFEADVHISNYYDWRHHRYHYREKWDDDGVTFLVRAGFDLRADIVYARFDASYIGEIYDDDDEGQFLLSGDLGLYIVPEVRLDCFGHYFTEYKSFYIGFGATITL